MAALTENYQLKWHSFGSHLHSSVALSLSNSSFTDVCLSTFDGHQILAHRFILSACSQYLHQVLKIQSKVSTTLPLFIILPPEINYKTMKVLIQYMYSGETTVSKDILENVLKGGDLLKVRGLWRPPEKEESEKTNKNEEKRSLVQYSIPVPKLVHFDKKSSEVTPLLVNTTSNLPKNDDDNTRESKKLQTSVSSVKSSETNDVATKTRITSTKENPRSTKLPSSEIKTVSSAKPKDSSKNSSGNLEFFVIKEEPIEWNDIQGSEMEMVEENNFYENEMTIKPEIIVEDNSNASKSEELYTPLTCELCSESFAHPGDWVKHIQTHTDMLPAKRQRRGRSYVEDENNSFPPLHCDLCREYFSTPAEWVRHIENSHTEFELRMSNTNDGKPMKVKPIPDGHKICIACNKKFPSHASMLIHKRTHTGEKPFMCEYCQKGFNVKSNLLRHLRTLHDKIINSTEVDQKENVTSDGDNDKKCSGESSGSA
ncbi:zinc finger and BTB domain-containing protein 17 [Agrilus planipennis]|uniref:Zinc finger and BTB domain-containing protein 17 n=1 Tax=Agrilus planipennis TaxID=224129 RepID=A0A1W4WGA4_AGRPL|nr:zinc finger and BTB domain-containing protein 17 [Agrilus planipennis]